MKLKEKLKQYDQGCITFTELKNDFENALINGFLDFVDIRKWFIQKISFYSDTKNFLGLYDTHEIYLEKMKALFEKHFDS